jgi:class 3 adenylate cyclase
LSSQANFRRADPKYSIDCAHLGIVLGDRRKLLRAIRELDVAPVVAPADAAERRQLTLMFCDLVGSTTLSASVDPEDLCAVIGAYHRCCARPVERHGGFVAKYMGDGVLVYSAIRRRASTTPSTPSKRASPLVARHRGLTGCR